MPSTNERTLWRDCGVGLDNAHVTVSLYHRSYQQISWMDFKVKYILRFPPYSPLLTLVNSKKLKSNDEFRRKLYWKFNTNDYPIIRWLKTDGLMKSLSLSLYWERVLKVRRIEAEKTVSIFFEERSKAVWANQSIAFKLLNPNSNECDCEGHAVYELYNYFKCSPFTTYI